MAKFRKHYVSVFIVVDGMPLYALYKPTRSFGRGLEDYGELLSSLSCAGYIYLKPSQMECVFADTERIKNERK